jgi:hypothetical protein
LFWFSVEAALLKTKRKASKVAMMAVLCSDVCGVTGVISVFCFVTMVSAAKNGMSALAMIACNHSLIIFKV